MYIGIITTHERLGSLFKKLLEEIFCGELEVNYYVVESVQPQQWDSRDVLRVIVTSYFDHIDVLPSDCPLVYMPLSYRKEKLVQLKDFPNGTKALLVNTKSKHAVSAIAQLYQNEIKNIEFLPYYPGCPLPPNVDIAVSPGELELAPPGMRKMVDIGDRVPDIQTILEIASRTGLEHILQKKPFLDYYQSLTGCAIHTTAIASNMSYLNKEYETIMDMVDIGIIAVDSSNTIHTCNQRALQLLGKPTQNLLFESILSLLPPQIMQRCKTQNTPLKTQIRCGGSRMLNLTIMPMMQNDSYIGAMIMILPVGGNEAFQHTLMERLSKKGHRAKYHFSDIIGNSPAMKQAIQLAEKMAVTGSSVLITGESGTGKELFAHSIHNHSPRAENPFVAINCAAIQDNLLESELFGYEGGSFTGAKKDGKIGLLEIANHGTVFLDEIEDMSPSLQVKLLRVIQERELMRVGGDTIIPIDVRFIFATNRSLPGRVQEGKFRQDLYYRISTLPLEIPPLRERQDDLYSLFESFRLQIGGNFLLSSGAKACLMEYSWPGNVRELRNCVEYLCCLGLHYIETQHLPKYVSGIKKEEGQDPENTVIHAIADILNQGSCGRQAISQKLASRGLYITPAQVRSLLERMKEMGWVETKSGRGGSFLTPVGKLALFEKNTL